MMSKRKVVVTILIVWVGLFVVVLLLTHKNSAPHTHNTALAKPPVVEKGSAGNQQSISIQGTEALNSYLLAEQFVAVKQALGRYIQSNISPSTLVATIAPGSTVLNGNGSINFTVQIAEPETTFNVLLQLPNAEEIIFSVVGTSYQDALYPYTPGGSTE
jgi:hypothetical protein